MSSRESSEGLISVTMHESHYLLLYVLSEATPVVY